jgi:arylsulfatase
LAEIREQNGGRPPNIIQILIDDVGFGEMGMPELNFVRGYRTPAINKLATEGLSLSRMYTEPSCTPTRTAFLTGRIPVRSHMLEPKVVPPEGSGLHADEVTIAEILSQAGYNTVHVGKWHQGDIEQAYPHNQGFDVAMFPMHNQATFNLMHEKSEEEGWAFSISTSKKDPGYALDDYFRPRGWVLGLEAGKGGQATEWGVEPGEKLGYEYYRKLNRRYDSHVVEQLERLAGEDKPFFLNYWPQKPIDFGRVGREFKTANGGAWVESMAELDAIIGGLLKKVEELGIADNTVVVLMGDNGPMKQALGRSGFTDMVYRGYKAESLEGGIRVNAFVRWPGVIKPRSYAGDIIHVSDLYTTFARIAGATGFIPRDRIIDGVDQTPLLLKGDGHSRRDYIHMYEGPNLAATIKQQFKVHWPAPGSPSFKLPVFDLYRDPREERALQVEAMWSVAYFGDMRARHLAFKQKYPDRPETSGEPYGGITDLRPETRELLKRYKTARTLLKP